MSNREPGRGEGLPGVDAGERSGPAVVFNAHDYIKRERRRATFRDFLDISLLLIVDVFFIWWGDARFPFFSRGDSIWLLGGVNALMIAFVLHHRLVKKWRARRIAHTWSPGERERFEETQRRRKP